MKKEDVRVEYPLKVKKYTKAHLDYLIRSQSEESVHMEFKSGAALNSADQAKKEISKDVSAFANSDGGIIIYGIAERNHTAAGFAFVDGNEYSKEWLEQVINSKIKRRIPDLTIDVIRVQNKISQSVYVVRIPRSYEAPHMASDGRFYKRWNFESAHMEEFEVRDLFHRTTDTVIKLRPVEFNGEIKSRREGKIEIYRLSVIIDVQNESRSIEHTYKTILRIPKSLYENGVKKQPLAKYFRKYQRDQAVLNVPGTTPLFSKEVNTVANFYMDIRKDDLADLSKNPFKIRFYYTNGIYELEYYLDTKLKVNGKILKEGDFT